MRESVNSSVSRGRGVTQVLHAALAVEDEHEAEEAAEGHVVLLLQDVGELLHAAGAEASHNDAAAYEVRMSALFLIPIASQPLENSSSEI